MGSGMGSKQAREAAEEGYAVHELDSSGHGFIHCLAETTHRTMFIHSRLSTPFAIKEDRFSLMRQHVRRGIAEGRMM
jgi:hypothetical protein